MAEGTGWRRVAKRIRVPMGFAFTVLFLFLARPTGKTMLWSLLLVAPGLWLRGYASGYVRKNAELTTSGPYAYTRNPLYLGSMLIAFGFGAASASWGVVACLAVLFAAIYVPTIQGEEEYLRGRFVEFNRYAAEVPRLLPRLHAAVSSQARGSFSRALYLHHREYNSLMGAGAVYLALALRLLAKRHGLL